LSDEVRWSEYMKLPNFFIVGAPKAGTDDLYYQLDQHPQIYMSPLKEPCFFSSEVRPERFCKELQEAAKANAASLRSYLDSGALSKRFGGMVSSFDDYQRLFRDVTGEVAVGEASVCYLWSASAAASISSLIPAARIIIVLMDPAERAFRQYLKSFADDNVRHPFSTHLENAFRSREDQISVYHPFLAFGNYAEQVRRYMNHFPREQIHLSLYEDVAHDGEAWFRSILDFLGVDSGFRHGPIEVPSAPSFTSLSLPGGYTAKGKLPASLSKLIPKPVKVPLKKLLRHAGMPSLLPEDRAVLIHYYRDNILKLEELIGRDLSAWLRV
jgi:hypothetical protein